MHVGTSAFAVVVALALSGCDLCETTVLFEVAHLDKRAVVFETDCGATTRFNSQLSIVSDDDDLHDEDNRALSVYGRGRITSVVWDSATQVTVHYKPSENTYRKMR